MLDVQDLQKSREITYPVNSVLKSQKADAASVSKSMMTARESDGASLFTSSEFLTSQQVSSFFLRLFSKRKLKEGEMT